MKFKNIVLLFAFLSLAAMADDDIFQFDIGGIKVTPNTFENDQRSFPKKSDFMVKQAYPMTSDSGKRAALITIENTSSGNRGLESSHIMALFADGHRITASQIEDKISLMANGSQTLTVYFGEYEYPIIAVYAAKNLD